MVAPIDEDTWNKWRIAWRRSRQLGKDFAEFLNQVGLLLTPARRREIVALEIRRRADLLEQASARSLIEYHYGSTGSSALDMQRATVAWLRNQADKVEKGED